MTKETIYQPKYGKSYSLVIGINAYQKASPLDCARKDAETFAMTLEEKFAFPGANITLLTDGEATREMILGAFMEYTKEHIDQDDRIIVFFAGHGYTRTGFRGEVGYLIPVDGTSDDLNSLIRWDELTRNSELIPAKHILFIMDACYGGLALTRYAPPGTFRFVKDMLQRYSRQVLTSGKADEVVADAGGPRPGHSIFTGHLLEGLEGASGSGEGIITANGLMAYVYDKVAKDYRSRQTPHYGYLDGDGDLIFNPSLPEELSSPGEVDKDILIEISPTFMTPQVKEEDQVLSEKVKSYLSDPKERIRLDDLVIGEIRRVLYSAGVEHFPAQIPYIQVADFSERLKKYEHLIANIQVVVTLIAKWGTREYRESLEKVFSRLAESDTEGGGVTLWLSLRWYPMMLLLYSGGIAALSAYNYVNLATVLTAPVGTRHSGEATSEVIIPTMAEMVNITEMFKGLPGHDRHYVPRSEYIFKVLQPTMEDLLFLGRTYEQFFDTFEVLLALVYADLRYKEPDGGIWGPPGRFAYKRGGGNPFAKLIAVAEREKEAWGPISAGLFQGSFSRFKMIAEGYEERLKKLPWF